MPNTHNKSSGAKAKKDPAGQKTQGKYLLSLAVVVILVVIGAYFVFQSRDTSNQNGNNSNNGSSSSTSSNNGNPDSGAAKAGDAVGTMSLTPVSSTIAAGKNFTVQIYEDSQGDKVNAVQANLTYPTNLLDFVKIDASNSAFGVTAPSHGGNGTVTIARGTINPVLGKQLVATVTFKPKTSSGNATIDFANGSAVLRSTDNKNTLNDTTGATYQLTQ